MKTKNVFLSAFLLLSFFTNTSYSQEQNAEAIYHIKSIINFSDHKNFEIQPILDKMEEDSEHSMDVHFRFIYNEKESLFYHEEVDGLSRFDFTLSLPLLYARAKGKFYTNLETGEIQNEKEFDDEMYMVKSNTKDYEWVLVDETRKIGTYECSKAIIKKSRKRKDGSIKRYIIEAWYTKEIEISSGPMGYGGLPGLIVQLKDGDSFLFYLSQIAIKPSSIEKIEIPNEGQEITNEEYDKIVKSRFDKRTKIASEKRDTSGFRNLLEKMFKSIN